MSDPLTPTEAQDFIEKHYGQRAGALSPLPAGEWSRAYVLALDGQEAVVRFGAYGEDFAKDQVMAEFDSARLPIPRVLEVGEAPTGWFAVSVRARGTLLDDLDEAGMRSVLPALLAALDATRDIDASDRHGSGIWTPDRVGQHSSWREALLDIRNDHPSDRVHGWRVALEGSSTGAGPFDEAFKVLRQLVEDMPDDRHVIHGDLLNGNVLVDGDHVTAVLDWGNSLYGDYLYDAAWLCYWWRWYPSWVGIDIRSELSDHWAATGGLPKDAKDRLRCYQIHIGLDAQAYNAFKGRWDQLETNAQQTLALVDAGS